MLRPIALKTHHYLLILFFFTLLAYGPALRGQFIWDDKVLILEDPRVQGSFSLSGIFASELYPGTSTNYYRPLLTLSFCLDQFVFGASPRGPHVVNILLHFAVGASLFFVLRRMAGNARIAFFSSLIFLVHPIHTQVVAYVSGRADALAAFFSLACLFYFLRAEGKGRKVYGASLVFFVLALLSKESAFITPFVLWAADICWKPRPGRPGRLAPFFILLAVYGMLRVSVLNFSAGNPFLSKMGFALTSVGLGERLFLFCKSSALYLGTFFFPLGLHMERWTAFEPVSFFSVAGTAIGIVLGWFFVKRQPSGGSLRRFFCWWFVLWFLPQSAMVLPYIMAEHFFYLPSMALAVALGVVLAGWPVGLPKRLFLAAGCVYLTVLTWVSVADWHDEKTFFEKTVALAPRSFRARDSLANLYLQEGRSEEAMVQYRRLIDPEGLLRNEDIEALGRFALREKKDPRESKVIGSAFYNIGVILEKEGGEEAYRAYRYALLFDPFLREAYNNLGLFCLRRERSVEAESFFRLAIRIDKKFVSAYNNLALLLFGQGKEGEAIGLWKAALEIDPSYETARKNLAIALNEPVS